MKLLRKAMQTDMEAINFNFKSTLGPELEAEIKELRKGKVKVGRAVESLSDIVKRHTNMLVTIRTTAENDPYVTFPVETKNSVLLDESTNLYGDLKDSNVADALYRMDKITAGVNFKSNRVSGVFTKVPVTVYIGIDNLKPRNTFTEKEVVAIILHEVGHAFTYFEMFGRMTKTNFLLSELTKRNSDNYSDEQRTEIIEAIEGYYDCAVPVKDAYVNLKTSKDANIATVISLATRESRSELDIDVYNVRSWEQLADEYATRLGYGKDLVTGMDKLYKISPDYTSSLFKTVMVSLLQIVGTLVLLGPIFGTIGLGVYLKLSDYEYRSYDKKNRRAQRIVDELHLALKDKSLDSQTRSQILKSIKDIEAMDKVKEYDSIANLLIRVTSMKTIKMANLQKELERMSMNKLSTAALIMKGEANG